MVKGKDVQNACEMVSLISHNKTYVSFTNTRQMDHLYLEEQLWFATSKAHRLQSYMFAQI